MVSGSTGLKVETNNKDFAMQARLFTFKKVDFSTAYFIRKRLKAYRNDLNPAARSLHTKFPNQNPLILAIKLFYSKISSGGRQLMFQMSHIFLHMVFSSAESTVHLSPPHNRRPLLQHKQSLTSYCGAHALLKRGWGEPRTLQPAQPKRLYGPNWKFQSAGSFVSCERKRTTGLIDGSCGTEQNRHIFLEGRNSSSIFVCLPAAERNTVQTPACLLFICCVRSFTYFCRVNIKPLSRFSIFISLCPSVRPSPALLLVDFICSNVFWRWCGSISSGPMLKSTYTMDVHQSQLGSQCIYLSYLLWSPPLPKCHHVHICLATRL